jgi:hypothetical protein
VDLSAADGKASGRSGKQSSGKQSSGKVTVSPLTAEFIEGPDGCGVESSYVLNTGEGLAWTMDWSPPNARDGSSLLAVGCHPPGSSDSLHELTELCCRKDAVVQVWKVEGSGKEARVEPLVRVVHSGGVTWSLSWCPSPRAACKGRLGLLGAVLGDGRVCVWEIRDGDSARGGAACRVPPVAEIPPHHVDGSIPCTLDWLPHDPYDLLLVGYRDGCVSIVQLSDGDAVEERMNIRQYFPAEALTLTAAKWFPGNLRDASLDDGAERRTFVTCGHESALNIWDARLEYAPKVSIKTGCAYTIQDMCWTTSPLGIMLAMEDASVRGLLMGAHEIDSQLKSGRPLSLLAFRGNLVGSLWAIDAGGPSVFAKEHHSVAYGGEDGIVGIMGNVSYQYLAKKRKEPDVALARLEVCGDSESTFKLSSGNKVEEGTLYQAKSTNAKERSAKFKEGEAQFTNGAHAIYSLRWSKAGDGETAGQWLAYGNASGIVHLVWVKRPSKHKGPSKGLEDGQGTRKDEDKGKKKAAT